VYLAVYTGNNLMPDNQEDKDTVTRRVSLPVGLFEQV
jgi:hypothetical protein